jgi:hypothetical protein
MTALSAQWAFEQGVAYGSLHPKILKKLPGLFHIISDISIRGLTSGDFGLLVAFRPAAPGRD